MRHALSQRFAQLGLPAPSGNVYCIGRNYAKHAAELGNAVPSEPVVFLKAPSSLRLLEQGPLAFSTETFHHEAELVVMIGKSLTLGEKGDWRQVAAVGLGVDLTRREAQNELKAKSLPWTLAKSFAGAALIGGMVHWRDELAQGPIQFSLKVNGELRQMGDTSHMLFPVPTIISYLASFNELGPGDLIFTGTPEGVGPVHRGDALELESATLGIRASGRL